MKKISLESEYNFEEVIKAYNLSRDEVNVLYLLRKTEYNPIAYGIYLENTRRDLKRKGKLIKSRDIDKIIDNSFHTLCGLIEKIGINFIDGDQFGESMYERFRCACEGITPDAILREGWGEDCILPFFDDYNKCQGYYCIESKSIKRLLRVIDAKHIESYLQEEELLNLLKKELVSAIEQTEQDIYCSQRGYYYTCGENITSDIHFDITIKIDDKQIMTFNYAT